MRFLRIMFSCFAMWFGVMALQDAVRDGNWGVCLAALTILIPHIMALAEAAACEKRTWFSFWTMAVYNMAFLGILIFHILLLLLLYGFIESDLKFTRGDFRDILLVPLFLWWMIDQVGFLLLAGNRGSGGMWAVPFAYFLVFTFLFIGLVLECDPFKAVFGYVVGLGIGFVLNVLTMIFMARGMKRPFRCEEKEAEKAGHEAGV